MANAPLLKTPVIRLGGKTRMLPALLAILEQMAPHICYCEPFCGGAALLFAKRPSEVEIINDRDAAIYDFFRVMRDTPLAEELQRRLTYTPWSRHELQECHAHWRTTEDLVERVRQWFAIMRMSFTHEIERPSWWAAKQENQAYRFSGAMDSLLLVSQRLRRCQIDNRSFEHMFKLYDSPNTLWYCDPPYLLSERVAGGYGDYELTDEEHAHLLDLVLFAKGQVLLSGYPSDLYTRKVGHLPRLEKTRECTIHNSGSHKKTFRTECVWIKAHPYGLFSALEGAEQEERYAGFTRQLLDTQATMLEDEGEEERVQVFSGTEEACPEILGAREPAQSESEEEVPQEDPHAVAIVDETLALRNFPVAWEQVSCRFL